MKMFVNNSIDLICITYFLYKTVLNCLVAVKSCFWQYDLWLIFRKVLKIYVIIIFPDPKPLFCIRELSSCCFSINFWGYRHSHSGNFRREAKKRCWKITKKFLTFLTLFKTLRTSQERHGDLFGQLEEFVCFVCCAKVDSINNVKWNKFYFFNSLQGGPSVSCNTRNKRPWWLPNDKMLWINETFPGETEIIRQEADDGNQYVSQDYAIGSNV